MWAWVSRADQGWRAGAECSRRRRRAAGVLRSHRARAGGADARRVMSTSARSGRSSGAPIGPRVASRVIPPTYLGPFPPSAADPLLCSIFVAAAGAVLGQVAVLSARRLTSTRRLLLACSCHPIPTPNLRFALRAKPWTTSHWVSSIANMYLRRRPALSTCAREQLGMSYKTLVHSRSGCSLQDAFLLSRLVGTPPAPCIL
jgi:hypothetical protein